MRAGTRTAMRTRNASRRDLGARARMFAAVVAAMLSITGTQTARAEFIRGDEVATPTSAQVPPSTTPTQSATPTPTTTSTRTVTSTVTGTPPTATPTRHVVVGTGTGDSCNDAALDAALVGGGAVTFDCGGPAAIDVNAGTGTKTISEDTVIDGAGVVTISGGNSVGVFSVVAGVRFEVRHLTIADGAGVEGGAISNDGGTVTISDSVLRNNVAQIGGAVANLSGAMTISATTFAENAAEGKYGGSGGAMVNLGTLAINRSLFVHNQAPGIGSGGAIDNSGTLSVANCTFVDNTAGAQGGGIFGGAGASVVTNATFTGNRAMGCFLIACVPDVAAGAVAGGTAFGLGMVSLRNTIVAGNTRHNCRGVTDGGHNIDDGTSCGFEAASGSLSNADPKLDPRGLRDNGGPTKTVALRPESPAIAAGDGELCAGDPVNGVDQRGHLRPADGHADCSMGACEIDAEPEPCVGDCNGDCAVAVSELQIGLMFFGQPAAAGCPGFAAADSAAELAQLQLALTNIFEGCPLCVPKARSNESEP